MPIGTHCVTEHRGKVQSKVKRTLEEAARKAAQVWPDGQVTRHIYQCQACDWWHLTRRQSRGAKSREIVEKALKRVT